MSPTHSHVSIRKLIPTSSIGCEGDDTCSDQDSGNGGGAGGGGIRDPCGGRLNV